MIVTKRAIPRRTFLRGAGATLALPLLDAMVPALTASATTAANGVPRLGYFYVPNGIHMPLWKPDTPGKNFTFVADPAGHGTGPGSPYRAGWAEQLPGRPGRRRRTAYPQPGSLALGDLGDARGGDSGDHGRSACRPGLGP